MADLKKAAENLKKLGYTVHLFETKEAAADYLDSAIDQSTVGFGGCQTAQQMGLYERLEKHNEVHWHWINGPEERKAAMVSNLLVVLCGNHDAQPIVNTGSLY